MALSALFFIATLRGPVSVTFVRHGETVANATGKYNSKTLNTLSAKGAKQAFDLSQRLEAGPRFDRILVSPAPRVMQTIASYLRATHTQATIWPLLYECCTGRRPKDAHATQFTYGEKIKIPAEFNGLFILEPGHDRYPIAPKYNEGLAQVDASVAEFKQRFTRGRILLVGHSGQGGHFIRALTGKWIKVDNAREIAVPLP